MSYTITCDRCGGEVDYNEMDENLICDECGQEFCIHCSNFISCEDCGGNICEDCSQDGLCCDCYDEKKESEKDKTGDKQ